MSKPLKIVRLDGIISPSPVFSPDFIHEYISFEQTSFDHDLIASRIAGAE